MRKRISSRTSAPIIVCGMHRSGTSLIARSLSELGVFMGNDLEENHESLSHLLLNDKLLGLTHSSWDQINGAFSFFNDPPAIDQAVEYLHKEIVEKDFIKQYSGKRKKITLNKWGWKDPRNTITFPLWLRLYPKAKIIFIYRNGIDSGASLKFREQKQNFTIDVPAYSSRCKSLEGGYSLWEDYNLFFHQHQGTIPGDQLFELKYEDFLLDPKSILRKLEEFCELDKNDVAIECIQEKINSDRAFSFLDNQELADFYEKVKDTSLMKRLGYSNIILNEPKTH